MSGWLHMESCWFVDGCVSARGVLAQGRKLGKRDGTRTAFRYQHELVEVPMVAEDMVTYGEVVSMTKTKHNGVRCWTDEAVAAASMLWPHMVWKERIMCRS